MDKIAWISGDTFVYWYSLILTLGVLAGMCVFMGLFLRSGGSLPAGLVFLAAAVVLSLVLSRLVHWYCRPTAYESLAKAMTDLSGGGYALCGVFAGCVFTALALRLMGIVKDLPGVLDCLALAGSLAIAVGRLACLYSGADRGAEISGVTSLPLVYPVVNPVSGAAEYRFATFLFQAVVAAALFGVLSAYRRWGRKRLPGDVALLFMAWYGASQILWDSTRYDSLFLRSNGFVSVAQILSALALVTALVTFSLRMWKRRGWQLWYVPMWLSVLGMLAGAGYMEYYVQRHGNQALFAYTVMGACLLGLVGMSWWIHALGTAGSPEGGGCLAGSKIGSVPAEYENHRL